MKTTAIIGSTAARTGGAAAGSREELTDMGSSCDIEARRHYRLSIEWQFVEFCFRLRSGLFGTFLEDLLCLLTDLFHSINVITVHGCLNGDMRHAIGCSRTMPVFYARWYPYDITRFYLFG